MDETCLSARAEQRGLIQQVVTCRTQFGETMCIFPTVSPFSLCSAALNTVNP